VGSARLLVPSERVRAVPAEDAGASAPRRGRISLEAAPAAPGGDGPGAASDAGRCDLRGLRVDEAEDRLVEALDHAASADRGSLVIIHGLGTGALRNAVRHYLKESPYVSEFAAAPPNEGGDGVTIAKLR
jgi:DNA mismatch repair protein MutS2